MFWFLIFVQINKGLFGTKVSLGAPSSRTLVLVYIRRAAPKGAMARCVGHSSEVSAARRHYKSAVATFGSCHACFPLRQCNNNIIRRAPRLVQIPKVRDAVQETCRASQCQLDNKLGASPPIPPKGELSDQKSLIFSQVATLPDRNRDTDRGIHLSCHPNQGAPRQRIYTKESHREITLTKVLLKRGKRILIKHLLENGGYSKCFILF